MRRIIAKLSWFYLFWLLVGEIRVKHPESKFGKNLMIMYIIADVIAVIMVLLVLGTCVTGCLGLS